MKLLSLNYTAAILNNFIGLPGLSVASPSRENPNYFFHWIRDGALSVDAVSFTSLMFNYINSSAVLQSTPTIAGLGEPKFFPNGEAFNGSWGRPQNDGPALRAMAVLKFAQTLEVNLANEIFDMVKLDLDYIVDSWRELSFDLWEELRGVHLFTLLTQYGALKAGAVAARDVGLRKVYHENLKAIEEYLNQHIDTSNGFICEHMPCSLGGRRGLDAATLIGVLELERLAGWTVLKDGIPLVLDKRDPRVLATALVLRYDNAVRYPINAGFAGGVGRYPEDVYDGYGTSLGNPWFITTSALVEVLVANGRITEAFEHLVFMDRHMGDTLSEQINRDTGYMQGAENLTWSYAAVKRAVEVYDWGGYEKKRKKKKKSESWFAWLWSGSWL